MVVPGVATRTATMMTVEYSPPSTIYVGAATPACPKTNGGIARTTATTTTRTMAPPTSEQRPEASADQCDQPCVASAAAGSLPAAGLVEAGPYFKYAFSV